MTDVEGGHLRIQDPGLGCLDTDIMPCLGNMNRRSGQYRRKRLSPVLNMLTLWLLWHIQEVMSHIVFAIQVMKWYRYKCDDQQLTELGEAKRTNLRPQLLCNSDSIHHLPLYGFWLPVAGLNSLTYRGSCKRVAFWKRKKVGIVRILLNENQFPLLLVSISYLFFNPFYSTWFVTHSSILIIPQGIFP